MATTPEPRTELSTATTDHVPSHSLPALLATVVDEVRARRAAHAARLQLIRELSAYSHPGDLDDLYATLDRHGDAETDEIRTILRWVQAA